MSIGVLIMSTTAADLSEEQLKRYRPFHRDKKPGLSSGAKKVAAQVELNEGVKRPKQQHVSGPAEHAFPVGRPVQQNGAGGIEKANC